jgi:probable addiction module antidote protein
VDIDTEGAEEMSKTTGITPFDASEYLNSEETIAAYLNEALASGDEDVVLAAFRDIAKARGMAKVAADAGVQRESLYKSLNKGAKPRFETILKVANALGVRLVIEVNPSYAPLPEAAKRAARAARKTASGTTARKPRPKAKTGQAKTEKPAGSRGTRKARRESEEEARA